MVEFKPASNTSFSGRQIVGPLVGKIKKAFGINGHSRLSESADKLRRERDAIK